MCERVMILWMFGALNLMNKCDQIKEEIINIHFYLSLLQFEYVSDSNIESLS